MQAAIKITILYLSLYDINTDILVFICSIISVETFPGEKEREFFPDPQNAFFKAQRRVAICKNKTRIVLQRSDILYLNIEKL